MSLRSPVVRMVMSLPVVAGVSWGVGVGVVRGLAGVKTTEGGGFLVWDGTGGRGVTGDTGVEDEDDEAGGDIGEVGGAVKTGGWSLLGVVTVGDGGTTEFLDGGVKDAPLLSADFGGGIDGAGFEVVVVVVVVVVGIEGIGLDEVGFAVSCFNDFWLVEVDLFGGDFFVY
jgi:hypothetical protein